MTLPGDTSESSMDVFSTPKIKGEEQAYVPYLFARDTIVRVVNDMKDMKSRHVTVISQIEMNYKMIEDETQVCLPLYPILICYQTFQ